MKHTLDLLRIAIKPASQLDTSVTYSYFLCSLCYHGPIAQQLPGSTMRSARQGSDKSLP